MNAALIIFLLCALAGFALACAGTFILLGLGWALVAGGASMFCVAAFIRRGLARE